jgi:hypothetical protein
MTDAFAKAMEPFWGTPLALLDALGAAQAGTLLFALFVFIAALELLRSGTGLVAHAARALAVVALGMAAATFVYGDYLAPPAAAMLSQSGLGPQRDHALVAVLGVAAVGVAYGAGRFEGAPRRAAKAASAGWRALGAPRACTMRSPDHEAPLSAFARLQQRHATHNPKRVPPRIYRAGVRNRISNRA